MLSCLRRGSAQRKASSARTAQQEDRPDPPGGIAKVPHFIRHKWSVQNAVLTVGEPLFEHLISAKSLPHAKGVVSTVRAPRHEVHAPRLLVHPGSSSPRCSRDIVLRRIFGACHRKSSVQEFVGLRLGSLRREAMLVQSFSGNRRSETRISVILTFREHQRAGRLYWRSIRRPRRSAISRWSALGGWFPCGWGAALDPGRRGSRFLEWSILVVGAGETPLSAPFATLRRSLPVRLSPLPLPQSATTTISAEFASRYILRRLLRRSPVRR